MSWEKRLKNIIKSETTEDALRLWNTGRLKPLFNYRYEHTKAVVSTARHLQSIEGGNKKVILAAAWLHDISKKSFHSDKKDFHHGAKSAEYAGYILKDLDFSEDEITAVQKAIEDHVGLFSDGIDRSLEGKIIWDADKLTKVGAVSVAHAFSIGPAYGGVTTRGILKRGLKWAETVEKIVESFHTDEAKKLGKQRLAFLMQFYHQLKIEME